MPIAAYHTKPLRVEAMQWNGPEDSDALREFIGAERLEIGETRSGAFVYLIDNVGRAQRVHPGDWVVHDTDREFRLYKPEEFADEFAEAA